MDYEHLCLAAINAYHRIYPGSFFGRVLEISDLENAKSSLVFMAFRKTAPDVKEDEYFLVLKAIEKDVDGFYKMIITGEREGIIVKIEQARKETDKDTLEKFMKYLKEEKEKL